MVSEQKYLVEVDAKDELSVCTECARNTLRIDTTGMPVHRLMLCAICGQGYGYSVYFKADQVPVERRKLLPPPPPPPPAWLGPWKAAESSLTSLGGSLLHECEMGAGFGAAIDSAVTDALRAAFCRGWEERDKLAKEELAGILDAAERAEHQGD